MKAPVFSAYARNSQASAAIVHALTQIYADDEQPSPDEQRYQALFAYARNPFDIRVVYDEQPDNEAKAD